MTKLRTRMGTDTLLNLAELKMHLRDEHVRKDVKERLKRHFGVSAQSNTAPTIPSQSSSSSSASVSDEPQRRDSTPNTMREIARSLERMVESDADLPSSAPSQSAISEPLSNLFDLNTTYWTERHKRSSVRSLDEELELYECLDLDADGEEADLDDVAEDC